MNSIRKPGVNPESHGLSELPPYTATFEDVRGQLENKPEWINLSDGRIITWEKWNGYTAVRITNTVQGGYCEIRQLQDGTYVDHTVDSITGEMPDQPIFREEVAKRLQTDIMPHLPVNWVQRDFSRRTSTVITQIAA